MKNRLIILLAVLSLLFACKRESQNAGEIGAHFQIKNNVSEFKVPVKVFVAGKGNTQKAITIYGKLLPKQETKLSSQFAGRILNLNLSEGDRVIKGETVAFIQSPQAEALQRVVPEDSLNKGQEDEIVPYPVRAPFNGIITKKYHYSGDVISAGETILTLLDDSVYYLWGQLPANYLENVRIGQQLKITFPDIKGKTFYAKVETINSTVDDKTQMAQIRASLLNQGRLLKSGLFAKVEIVLQSAKNVLLIPRSSVLENSGGYFVFIKKNGKAIHKNIVAGIENADVLEVKSGLSTGDSIIVLGNYELKDGMQVEVMR